MSTTDKASIKEPLISTDAQKLGHQENWLVSDGSKQPPFSKNDNIVIDREEIPVTNTKWNKFVYFMINCYELLILTLTLCLSVYQDDATTFIYLFCMQAVLHFSLLNRGAQTGL